jgi:hypothetical protein
MIMAIEIRKSSRQMTSAWRPRVRLFAAIAPIGLL